jgi:hypothetical protein
METENPKGEDVQQTQADFLSTEQIALENFKNQPRAKIDFLHAFGAHSG